MISPTKTRELIRANWKGLPIGGDRRKKNMMNDEKKNNRDVQKQKKVKYIRCGFSPHVLYDKAEFTQWTPILKKK